MFRPKVGDKVRVKSLEDMEKVYSKREGCFNPTNFRDLWENDPTYREVCGEVVEVIRVANNGTTPVSSMCNKHFAFEELDPLVNLRSIYE